MYLPDNWYVDLPIGPGPAVIVPSVPIMVPGRPAVPTPTDYGPKGPPPVRVKGPPTPGSSSIDALRFAFRLNPLFMVYVTFGLLRTGYAALRSPQPDVQIYGDVGWVGGRRYGRLGTSTDWLPIGSAAHPSGFAAAEIRGIHYLRINDLWRLDPLGGRWLIDPRSGLHSVMTRAQWYRHLEAWARTFVKFPGAGIVRP